MKHRLIKKCSDCTNINEGLDKMRLLDELTRYSGRFFCDSIKSVQNGEKWKAQKKS